MQIKIMPIGDVKPYENNPRINTDAVGKVAQSIEQFGFRQPIVVDKNNVVIVGHTRLEAAKSLGITEVPVHVTDLDDDKVKAYRIADNKVAEYSEWDFEMLKIEMEPIKNVVGEFFLPEELASIENSEYSTMESDADTLPEIDLVGEQPGKEKVMIIRFPDEAKFHAVREKLGITNTRTTVTYEEWEKLW
jgi:ParB-like chromosome segregation protein Spo0J